MHQEWTDQLSDFLDGELSAEEQQAVAAHLRECAACGAVLNDLKRVVARAGSIDAHPPQADLWAGIAGRIEAGGPAPRVVPFATRERRRFAFTLPQLAAAAALLIAVSGGIAWQAAERLGATKSLEGRPEGLRYETAATTASPSSVAQPFPSNVA